MKVKNLDPAWDETFDLPVAKAEHSSLEAWNGMCTSQGPPHSSAPSLTSQEEAKVKHIFSKSRRFVWIIWIYIWYLAAAGKHFHKQIRMPEFRMVHGVRTSNCLLRVSSSIAYLQHGGSCGLSEG